MDSIYMAIHPRDVLSKLDSTNESIGHGVEVFSHLSQRRGHLARPSRFIVCCSVPDASRPPHVSKRRAIWVAFVLSLFRCWLDQCVEVITKGINNELRSHSAAHRAMPRSPI